MAGTQAVTILFCDLVASTERRARLGDDAFDEFTRRFMRELRTAIADADGREVSSAGDGLMVVFPRSVADALACAADMHSRVAALDPDDPARIRVGISCGEVAQDGDDYSGMPIVEAARLEAAAAPGSTLASAVVRSLVGTRRAFRFRDVGALTLKGLPAPLATVEVVDDDVVDLPPPAPVAPVTTAGPRRRGRVWAAVVAAVVVIGGGIALVAALSGSDGSAGNATTGLPTRRGYQPRYESTACPADVRSAAAGATCGRLVVPENREKPHGRQISLLVKRAPAREPAAGAVPDIDLCGCEDLGNSIGRDHAELIQLSSRGFPGSDPELKCPEVSAARTAALTRRAADPAEIARTGAAFGQCHDRLTRQGVDVRQYNYAVAAEDAIDLLIALHIPRADFTASELVSSEVFQMVRRAPGAVRSITVDNPAPPDETEFTDPVGDLADAYDRLVAQCDASTTCAQAYPDLQATWRSTYEQFEAAPTTISAAPDDRPGSRPVTVLLDGPRAAGALGAALDNAQTYGLIPAAITDSTTDAAIASQVVSSDYYSFHPDAPWGTLASYLCAYDVHTVDPGAALQARTRPQFTRVWNAPWLEWCKSWPVPSVEEQLSDEVVSTVPAFFFRGAITSFGSADWLPSITRGMANAQTVVFPTLGSGLLSGGPPCLSDLRRKFLADPNAKLPTAACARQSPPIDFTTPSG